MAKLWGGRFEGGVDKLVEQLGESVSFDSRLAPWDIRGSLAHAQMLGEVGVLSKKDVQAITRGLKKILADVEAGRFQWDVALEDVHTNIEAALVADIGDAGKRLHTGRSRNDQSATDVRLWARDQIDAIVEALRALQCALLELAGKHIDVLLPGFTHLQHAQPVLLAHHLHAYIEMFARDEERFAQLRPRVNVLPLGSAALAGTPYPIDRELVAKLLGFERVSANSMDAVADRDHLIEFCSSASLVMMHLSRLCEELVLWSSPCYGFIEIGEAFTTGSSIMPQKRNPDVAELVRGKAGRVYGSLTALLTLMKGLPLTYNRDMQEDKPPVFDASDTVQLCLAVVTKMVPSIRINRDAMTAALQLGFLEATDLADYLATKGVPFREAHGIVGRLVLQCTQQGKRLTELSLAELQAANPAFEADVFAALTPEAMVRRRDNAGATAPRRVKAALAKARKRLAR
jgi:argininosuccinate lyase